jgi:divalent metal cation (Fe/Co/Zn/Cd) transporter
MGQSILVDVHVLVGSQVTVSEGHMTAVRVRAELQNRFEYISEVLVHVDPEDDAAEEAYEPLPSREELLERLDRRWREAGIEVTAERVNFHYLGGCVDVEILLSLDEVMGIDEARRLSRRLVEATRKEQHVGTIDVLFR